MGKSLSVKYRPILFNDVIGQDIIVNILQKQVEHKSYNNAYLFYGPSGCGKTTVARIFANEVNQGKGNPIEIDAASNNGVDNVKQIVKESQERSVDSEYKIFIIDECHSLTIQAWQAFLKCIEETPKYTIFIFCTTEYNKVPTTIINRSIEFNFHKVDPSIIENRLKDICKNEGFINYEDACNYISKTCNGRVRDAISTLERCSLLGIDLYNYVDIINSSSYNDLFILLNYIIDGKEKESCLELKNILNKYNSTTNFVNDYLSFILDLNKYIICKDLNVTRFSNNWLSDINKVTNFENSDKYYSYLTKKLIDLKKSIYKQSDCDDFVYYTFISMVRCE